MKLITDIFLDTFEKYKDEIEILIGFEAEYIPEYVDYYKNSSKYIKLLKDFVDSKEVIEGQKRTEHKKLQRFDELDEVTKMALKNRQRFSCQFCLF